MRRAVNEVQLKVLHWIAAGCPIDRPPTGGVLYKTSAKALQGRGLVKVSHSRGLWQADLTDAGLHYLEHGAYPTPSPTRRPGSRHPAPTATDVEPYPAEAATDVDTSDESRYAGNPNLPVITQIRQPHPAVRVLLDNPGRVDLPAAARRRVHLICHTLVQEALRRGWRITSVTPHTGDSSSLPGSFTWWPSADLFRVNAGERDVGVRFTVKTTRTGHVDTLEQARDRAHGRYVNSPRYDFNPTDVLRLFLYHDKRRKTSWEDTQSTPVEDRLPAVLASIDESTKSAIAHREAERHRHEEQQRRYAEEARQQQRVIRYDAWLGALQTLRDRSRDHAELLAAVRDLAHHLDRVEDGDVRDRVARFLDWAREHLDAADPLHNLQLPAEPVPDMTYDEWTHWSNHFSKPRYSSGWLSS